MHKISFILLIIGGLNWLLVGLGVWNLGQLFGPDSVITKVIYILVGLSAIYEIVSHKKLCKNCDMPKSGSGAM